MNRLYLLLALFTICLSCKMDPDTELTQFPPNEHGIPFMEVIDDGDSEDQEDFSPPALLSCNYEESGDYLILFDEEPVIDFESTAMEPQSGDWELTVEENQIRLHWKDAPLPVTEYKLSITLADSLGNSNWFILPFWTPNPDQALLILNEATPKGSGNNPDCLEFFCTQSGTLGGITFYLGTASRPRGSYRFPESMSVTAGDYIILHCRPEGLDTEINELEDKGISGGLLSSNEAWDLWLPEDLSLPGTSGIFSLYSLPQDGSVMDCLVYTNRTYDPEDPCLGWTSTLFKELQTLETGAWSCSGEIITPEEAVWGDDSTGTRSLCRSSDSFDSGCSSDWHTVPTSGKTFGAINSDEIYQ